MFAPSDRIGPAASRPTITQVGYDEHLAGRIRALLADEPDVRERAMFGGLAFLVAGNMAIAASREGGVLVRVDPAVSDRLVGSTTAAVAVMGGRSMAGWLRVPADDVATARQLRRWTRLGVGYARSLPVKLTG